MNRLASPFRALLVLSLTIACPALAEDTAVLRNDGIGLLLRVPATSTLVSQSATKDGDSFAELKITSGPVTTRVLVNYRPMHIDVNSATPSFLQREGDATLEQRRMPDIPLSSGRPSAEHYRALARGKDPVTCDVAVMRPPGGTVHMSFVTTSPGDAAASPLFMSVVGSAVLTTPRGLAHNAWVKQDGDQSPKR